MPRSEKQNPASKPQTKRMLNAGLERAGDPTYPDHAPSRKLREQSAGAQRAGDNRYLGYPDASKSDDSASTDHTGAGSRKARR